MKGWGVGGGGLENEWETEGGKGEKDMQDVLRYVARNIEGKRINMWRSRRPNDHQLPVIYIVSNPRGSAEERKKRTYTNRIRHCTPSCVRWLASVSENNRDPPRKPAQSGSCDTPVPAPPSTPSSRDFGRCSSSCRVKKGKKVPSSWLH